MNNTFLKDIEAKITSGQVTEARHLLQAVEVTKVPRNKVCAVAQLAKRAGLSDLALKLIKPYVRSHNKLIEPTPTECLDYATALVSVGGAEEAVELLSRKEVLAHDPKAHLYLAFAWFARWDYRSALKPLQEYLSRTDEGSYQHAIGQVNYSAALINLELYEEAEKILLKLIPEFQSQNYSILSGNCRELLAQIYFRLNKTAEARRLLEEALPLLGGKMPDTLFVNKWLALIALKDNPGSTEAQRVFEDIRSQAVEIHHWESVRDLDFHSAMITSKLDILKRVYFGTPLNHYREQLLNKYPNIRQGGTLRHLEPGSEESNVISLEELFKGEKPLFKPGSLNHNMFHLLLADFYRPIRVGTLFEKLYPGEYFDPDHSAQKVKMQISRLRKSLKPFGIEITEMNGKGYMLTSQKGVCLKYAQLFDLNPENKSQLHLEVIQEKFHDRPFTCSEFARLMGVNDRTALRWLTELIEGNQILKSGARKGVRYQLLVSGSSQRAA